MKNKIYFLFLILFLVFIMNVKANSLPLIGKTIYIDPGHGGIDIGTSYKDIYEKNINLKFSLKIKEALEKKGAIVYLTRYGDYDLAKPNSIRRKLSDLSNRVDIINKSKCDLYISIHTNYYINSKYKGMQIFYTNKNSNNIVLANKLNSSLNLKRKIKIIENKYMYDKIKIPGVLIELGFLSNSNDRYLMQQNDYVLNISNNITKGIIKYFY